MLERRPPAPTAPEASSPAVEHHFYDYSFCPDNTEWLAYIAGRTSRVDVGTAAVIMPWNEPLRVAEKVALLDHLSNGRLRFGMGRGLSRREYSHFRGIEDDEPPPPLICDFVYCNADPDAAAERGPGYIATYLESVLEHYEIMGDHFQHMPGYEAYAGAAGALERMGASGFLEGFLDATCHGTPEQILDKYRARWELLGGFEAAPAFRFGGIPFAEAEESMRLFAAEVLPELQSWG